MCPPLASIKTFGADTRPFSMWTKLSCPPSLTDMSKRSPNLVSQASQTLASPLFRFIPQIYLQGSIRALAASLCFELRLHKVNDQVGVQPNHPLMIALFFYAGYY